MEGLLHGLEMIRREEFSNICHAIDRRQIVWVCGGPGTGKSLIVERVIDRYRSENKDRRIGFVTGQPNDTFHTLKRRAELTKKLKPQPLLVIDRFDDILDSSTIASELIHTADVEKMLIIVITRLNDLPLWSVPCVMFDPYTKEQTVEILADQFQLDLEVAKMGVAAAWPIVHQLGWIACAFDSAVAQWASRDPLVFHSLVAAYFGGWHGLGIVGGDKIVPLRLEGLPLQALCLLISVHIAQRTTLRADHLHYGQSRRRGGHPRIRANFTSVNFERVKAIAKANWASFRSPFCGHDIELRTGARVLRRDAVERVWPTDISLQDHSVALLEAHGLLKVVGWFGGDARLVSKASDEEILYISNVAKPPIRFEDVLLEVPKRVI